MHVDVVASLLHEYKGVVLLDPVIGDYKKGLFVSEETARAIRDMLVPMAQIITPNRFEAEVLLGTGDRTMTEHAYLNGLFDLGPQAVIITSFERDPGETPHDQSLHERLQLPPHLRAVFPRYPAHGAGDVFAASVAAFMALGGSPFAAALLCTRARGARRREYDATTAAPASTRSRRWPNGIRSGIRSTTIARCVSASVRTSIAKCSKRRPQTGRA